MAFEPTVGEWLGDVAKKIHDYLMDAMWIPAELFRTANEHIYGSEQRTINKQRVARRRPMTEFVAEWKDPDGVADIDGVAEWEILWDEISEYVYPYTGKAIDIPKERYTVI